eukprot:TRINITY_DN2136_c0_g1_i8.p1 TRINITY_DN2136_c0_g1~~TRINITY_DN2136_c0_g1_i8.p1  ORF type:complete len:594 (+),score=103.68 TRINITY_DN2136_c0_g1_i8:78-1784(+)
MDNPARWAGQCGKVLLLLLLLLVLCGGAAAWDADAGLPAALVPVGAAVRASSAQAGAASVVDGDLATFWQSDAFFPTGHVIRADANSFLQLCSKTPSACTSSSSPAVNMSAATDGSFLTGVGLTAGGATNVWAVVELPTPATTFFGVGLRCTTPGTVTVEVVLRDGSSLQLGTYTQQQNNNYVTLRFTGSLSSTASGVRVSAQNSFTLTELCFISESPFETITVDMGSVKEVTWICTRHYTGSAVLATTLLGSVDGSEWQLLANLHHDAIPMIPTKITTTRLRYIQIRDDMALTDWSKASVWEITAYDENGPYGALPTPNPRASVSLAKMLGVNGIWGWGTQSYSDANKTSVGPSLYTACSTHGRNYHNMNWDVKDPDNTPNYEAMADGKGTEAQGWLNWDTEYEAWVKSGLEVEASIQFTASMFPVSAWTDPEQDGYNYANAFAAHFGPSGAALIKVMEVGNEPWDYPAKFYQSVLRGFTNGAAKGDPKMLIVPCALQANSLEEANATSGNYIGTRVTSDIASKLDGLNAHAYSFVYNQTGARVGTYPENPASTMQSVRAMLRWRNA